MTWPTGDTSGSETLTSLDHLYESHINSLRESNPALAVVGKTSNSQYYCNGDDDEIQIQAAIDAVNTAGGGIVHILPGTYTFKTRQLMSGSIYAGVLMKANVTLEGEGKGETILTIDDALQANVIAATSKNWMSIKDLQINGNKANQTDDSVDGNLCGLYLGNAAYLSLENLYVHHCKRQGIYLGSSMSSSHVSNIMTYDNGREGLSLDFTLYSTIEGIIAVRNGYAGIYVSSAPGVNDMQLTILGGWLFDNDFGLRTDGVKHLKIIGTHAYYNDRTNATEGLGDGFLIEDSEDVELVGCSGYLNFRDGAIFLNSTNCRVTGGEFRNNRDQSGIRLANTTYTQVSSARCFDDQGVKTQNYGILETGTADYNTIQGCDLTGNATAGALIVGANTKIRNNQGYVTENSGTGTIASGATTAVVTHGLAVTPTLDDISITFGEQGTNDYGRWWISTITSTQFTLNVSADPSTSGLDFAWKAIVL